MICAANCNSFDSAITCCGTTPNSNTRWLGSRRTDLKWRGNTYSLSHVCKREIKVAYMTDELSWTVHCSITLKPRSEICNLNTSTLFKVMQLNNTNKHKHKQTRHCHIYIPPDRRASLSELECCGCMTGHMKTTGLILLV